MEREEIAGMVEDMAQRCTMSETSMKHSKMCVLCARDLVRAAVKIVATDNNKLKKELEKALAEVKRLSNHNALLSVSLAAATGRLKEVQKAYENQEDEIVDLRERLED